MTNATRLQRLQQSAVDGTHRRNQSSDPAMGKKYSRDEKKRFYEWSRRFLALYSAAGVVVPVSVMNRELDRLIQWIIKALERANSPDSLHNARALCLSELRELLHILGDKSGCLTLLFASFSQKGKDDEERAITLITQWIAFEKKRLEYWASLAPREFEIQVAKLLERDGFNVKVTSYSGDSGVDIWAWRTDDRVKMPVQCKHYQAAKAGVGAVRELIGAMKINDSRVGLLICTNGFTAGAHKLAEENKISLWDIEEVLLRANRDP